MSMDIVSSILDSVDTLKVIFLVRDPRATMLSRLEIDYMCPSMERCVPSFCRKLIEDSEISLQLEEKYPDRFKTMTYEDIASDPVNRAVEMYKFINFPYTQTDLDRIYKMTHSTGTGDEEMFTTSRKNSTETAWQWVKQANATVIKLIDRYCAKAYKMLGYHETEEITQSYM